MSGAQITRASASFIATETPSLSVDTAKVPPVVTVSLAGTAGLVVTVSFSADGTTWWPHATTITVGGGGTAQQSYSGSTFRYVKAAASALTAGQTLAILMTWN